MGGHHDGSLLSRSPPGALARCLPSSLVAALLAPQSRHRRALWLAGEAPTRSRAGRRLRALHSRRVRRRRGVRDPGVRGEHRHHAGRVPPPGQHGPRGTPARRGGLRHGRHLGPQHRQQPRSRPATRPTARSTRSRSCAPPRRASAPRSTSRRSSPAWPNRDPSHQTA